MPSPITQRTFRSLTADVEELPPVVLLGPVTCQGCGWPVLWTGAFWVDQPPHVTAYRVANTDPLDFQRAWDDVADDLAADGHHPWHECDVNVAVEDRRVVEP
jgi:hypothetical protein